MYAKSFFGICAVIVRKCVWRETVACGARRVGARRVAVFVRISVYSDSLRVDMPEIDLEF